MIQRHLVTFIFLFTVAFLLIFMTIMKWDHTNPPDYRSFYEPVARNIIAEKQLVTDAGEPAVRYPPGYSLVLAGVFAFSSFSGLSDRSVLWFFVLMCWGLSSVIFFTLAENLFGRNIALVAYALWLTYPFNLWLTLRLNVEILFMPLFLGFLYLMRLVLGPGRNRLWLALMAGFTAGASSLVRPIAFLMGFVAAVCMFLIVQNSWEKRLAIFGLMLLGNLFVIAPWELWAHSKLGRWIPLSTGGVPSMRDGLTFAVRNKNYRRSIRIEKDIKEIMLNVNNQVELGNLNTASEILSNLGKELKERPTGMMKLMLWKMGRSWYGTDSLTEAERRIRWVQLFFISLGIIGGIMSRKMENVRGFLYFGIILVLYFWALATISLSILRYMVPAMSIILLFSAFALFQFSTRIFSTASPQIRTLEKTSS